MVALNADNSWSHDLEIALNRSICISIAIDTKEVRYKVLRIEFGRRRNRLNRIGKLNAPRLHQQPKEFLGGAVA